MLNDCTFCHAIEEGDPHGEYIFSDEIALEDKQTNLRVPLGALVCLRLDKPQLEVFLDVPPTGDTNSLTEIPVSFCPMCGRKLKEGVKHDAE